MPMQFKPLANAVGQLSNRWRIAIYMVVLGGVLVPLWIVSYLSLASGEKLMFR
jgi:cell division septal protein FtsQ